jgi:hypothetical protein
MTAQWKFIPPVSAGATGELSVRLKLQTISDIYKAMQTRLDGYRQSTGAIFLAVFAASLTFDSVIIRLFFDKPTFELIQSRKPFLSCSFQCAASS